MVDYKRLAEESRAEQGLPPTVTDETTLAKVASLLNVEPTPDEGEGDVESADDEAQPEPAPTTRAKRPARKRAQRRRPDDDGRGQT